MKAQEEAPLPRLKWFGCPGLVFQQVQPSGRDQSLQSGRLEKQASLHCFVGDTSGSHDEAPVDLIRVRLVPIVRRAVSCQTEAVLETGVADKCCGVPRGVACPPSRRPRESHRGSGGCSLATRVSATITSRRASCAAGILGQRIGRSGRAAIRAGVHARRAGMWRGLRTPSYAEIGPSTGSTSRTIHRDAD